MCSRLLISGRPERFSIRGREGPYTSASSSPTDKPCIASQGADHVTGECDHMTCILCTLFRADIASARLTEREDIRICACTHVF